MHLTIPKTTLLPILARAKAAADAKAGPAICGTVKLAATRDKLTATATDLNVTTISTVEAKVTKPGTLCVDAGRIFDVVAKLPAGDVTLAVDDKELTVRAGKSTSRLICLAAADFPSTPDPAKHEFARCAAGPFATAIARTLPSVCLDETRFFMGGVALVCRGTRERFASTDGNRATIDEATLGLPEHAEIIIPRRGAGVLRDSIDAADETEIEVSIREPVIMVRAGATTVAVKLIDAKFPPVEQIIPKTHSRRATCNRKELLDAIGRASVMMERDDKELTHGMKFSLGDEGIVLDAVHKDYGSTREDVEASIDGEPVAIGLRPRYVRDALAALDSDEVQVDTEGELDPIVVRSASCSAFTVIMPMRL